MKKSTLLLSICSFCYTISLQAQTRFKVGDAVEVTNIGKGVIVGEFKQTEFGYGTYQVHLDGEKYCNNHVLDTRYNANYVIAFNGKGINEEKKVQKPSSTETVKNVGSFRIGDTVLYSQTAIWSSGVIKNYDPGTRLYTLQDVYVGIPCYAVAKPAKSYNNEFYVGTWDVRISGAMFTEKEGNKTYTKISGGMKLHSLQINKDGTYRWRIASNKTITGKWKARKDAPGIVIIKGIDGKDWTVYETTEAFATTKQTKDEIRFHHMPTNSGYYMATRIGPNKSCALEGKNFQK